MADLALYILKVNLLAAIIICLVHVISKFSKNKFSSWWRYYTWLAVSVILIIPFGLFRQTEVVSLEIPYQEETYETIQQPHSTINHPTLADQVPSVNEPAQTSSWIPHLSALSSVHYSNIFLYVWIGGIIVIGFIRILLYQISVYSLRRWAVSCRQSDYLSNYIEICKSRQIKRCPRLMINMNLSSPALAGLIRPILYLPDTDYNKEELKIIYHHELSHYQSKDLWYKLLLLFVNTVYWFNPALYLMRKEADKDIEYLCDSNVLKTCTGIERKAYHMLLLKTAEKHRRLHYISAGLNDDMTNFKERMLYMLKVKSLKKGTLLFVLLVALMLVSNTMVGCSWKKTAMKEDETVTEKSTESVSETASEIETENVTEKVTKSESDSKTETERVATEEISEGAEALDGSIPNETAEPNAPATNSNSSETSNNTEIDKSGDYIGDIPSPNPPNEMSYRVHDWDTTKSIVLYISNIDNANIKFYLTLATPTGIESVYHPDTYTEELIFKEHIAHYNGDGYYEYIGKDYHLYFEYEVIDKNLAAGYIMTVYGLENLFDQSQYSTLKYYNGISGIEFAQGLPFAG